MTRGSRPLKDLYPRERLHSDKLQGEFNYQPPVASPADRMLYRGLRQAALNIGVSEAQIIRQVLTTWLVRNGYLEQDALQRLGGK